MRDGIGARSDEIGAVADLHARLDRLLDVSSAGIGACKRECEPAGGGRPPGIGVNAAYVSLS